MNIIIINNKIATLYTSPTCRIIRCGNCSCVGLVETINDTRFTRRKLSKGMCQSCSADEYYTHVFYALIAMC